MQDIDVENYLEKLMGKLSGWGEDILLKVPNLILAIFTFVIFWYIGKYFSKLLKNVFLKKVKQESVKMIIAKTSFIVFVVIGFFIALGILDLDKVLTSVLAGAGVVGLAIGLALQGTLNNTFSGVVLSFLPRIQIGDWVETNGHSGRIIDITLRNVVIRDTHNHIILIPNSKIMENPFKNYSDTERARVIVSCGVGYESDLEFVKKLTTETIEKIFKPQYNEEVEFIYTEFGDSSINFDIRFWIDAKDNRQMLLAQSEAILAIKKAYNENDINIPFPIRTLDFGKNKFRSETLTVQNKEDQT